MSGRGFFTSPAYKKIMSKVYGWGASLVILGALWKILHWPGANLMLMVGLGTEAIIFFLSAFEPPHEMPDWSLVYPELVGLEPRNAGGNYSGGGYSGGSYGGGVNMNLGNLAHAGQLDGNTVEQLEEGLKRLSATAMHLSNLGDATLATDAYIQNLKSASLSVSELALVQSQAALNLQHSAEVLSAGYVAAAKTVVDSSTKYSDDISSTGASFVDKLKSSGDQLANSYNALGQNMTKQIEKISTDGVQYTDELAGANKNLSAINAVYELQLSIISAQVKASQDLTKNLVTINQHMNQSVPDVENYREEVGKLSQTLGELNTIYGNMLSAVNVGGHK